MGPGSVILVPIDFEATSRHALDLARQLAGHIGAKVVVLHVYALPPYVYPGIGKKTLARLREETAKSAQEMLDELVTKVGNVEPMVREGDPREVILEVIEQIKPAFVVMGTRGREGLSRMLVGSVAEEVLRESPVPVMTVRGPEKD